jgi:hypothetical protein
MPYDHCPVLPQVTAVDEPFGTHRLSVLTSVGRGPCSNARVKDRQVATRSCFSETSTSMSWPKWRTTTHQPSLPPGDPPTQQGPRKRSRRIHDPSGYSIHTGFYRSMVPIGANRQTNRGSRCNE